MCACVWGGAAGGGGVVGNVSVSLNELLAVLDKLIRPYLSIPIETRAMAERLATAPRQRTTKLHQSPPIANNLNRKMISGSTVYTQQV